MKNLNKNTLMFGPDTFYIYLKVQEVAEPVHRDEEYIYVPAGYISVFDQENIRDCVVAIPWEVYFKAVTDIIKAAVKVPTGKTMIVGSIVPSSNMETRNDIEGTPTCLYVFRQFEVNIV